MRVVSDGIGAHKNPAFWPLFQTRGVASISFGGHWAIKSVGNGVIYEEESEVLEITQQTASPPKIHTQPEVVPIVQFGGGQPGIESLAVIPTLRLILDRIKEVVGKFP